MSTIVNLKVDLESTFLVTKGIEYTALVWRFKGKTSTPDIGYILTIEKWNNGNDKTFNMTSGVSIVGNTIFLNLGTVTADRGTYIGVLKSISSVYGVAFISEIKFKVS